MQCGCRSNVGAPLVVKVLDLCGKVGGVVRGVKAGDGVDAALASQQPVR